jgi:hypothetical protein
MFWDALLLAVILYNTLRGARRGGHALGVELLAFAITYASTLMLAPLVASFIREHSANPPPFLSMISMLGMYCVVRRGLRCFLPGEDQEGEDQDEGAPDDRIFTEPSHGRVSGACLGVLRGSLVAVAIALLGCSLVRVQQAGLLRAVPPAHGSLAIQRADQLIPLIVLRYTRDAGPTTRALLDLALHPDEERMARFLEGPFVSRLKRSKEAAAFGTSDEIKRLVEAKQTLAVLTHPAFLRLLEVAYLELQNEEA